MIGHQHIGMDMAVVGFRDVFQCVQIKSVILLTKETGLTVIAPLYDVLGNAGELEAGFACHG